MTPHQAVLRLAQGAQSDLADYITLRDLLQAQFEAAVQHRSPQLAQIATDITTLCESLQERRAERDALAGSFAGMLHDTPRAQWIETAFTLLPTTYREPLQALWARLEALVRECQQLNTRNCALLMEQHSIMQRVLSTESDTYAPR
jgi:flagellar biosynthesis protein FlgN